MIDGHGDDIYKYDDIRLNFSSNIYQGTDLSELEAYLSGRLSSVRNYPSPTAVELEERIARHYGLNEDEVMVTSGATDAIYLIAQTFRNEGSYTVIHPTFSEYADACRMYGYEEKVDGALCWLCNPNNPTGELTDSSKLVKLAVNHKWLVVDQSYENYTLQRLMSPSTALCFHNVIQIRSLTKMFGVPGLRIGFITAPADVIVLFRRNYRPWAVASLAIDAGCWLFDHDFRLIPDLKAYMAEARRLYEMLNGVEGLSVSPTSTNFMLGALLNGSAAELKEYLAIEHGMLIRDATNFEGLTPHHFRVAAQTPEADDALVEAIREFLKTN